MKRNAKKSLQGNHNSELVTKLFTAVNSGAYGAVALPQDEDAMSVKNDISISNEHEDEKSGAKTNARADYAPIRMKGKTKVVISTHLHMTKNPEVESPLGKYLETLLGVKEVIAADRGAVAKIEDPLAQKAGLTVTTAGTLLGPQGNYVTLALVNAGATGTVAVAVTGKVFTLTYYNDSTVEDVVLALDAQADLVAAANVIGDDTTDLFVDLLASRALASGSVVYFNGGAKKGFLYSNEDAPTKDMTIIYNKEKVGQVVSGIILDKMTLELASNLPSIKFEGTGKRSVLSGVALLTSAAAATNRLYLGSEYKQFTYDPGAPSYIDVIDNDGLTYKSKANKIIGQGVDGTGPYIQVQNAVTADINDIVIFHEPENHNPIFAPANGMSGSVEVDGIVLAEKRNFKFEYANNHQVFDNLAFEDTVGGFSAAKMVVCKMSVEVNFKKELLPLVQKLQAQEVAVVPMKIEIGTKSGETMVIFARNVSIKSPDLQDKADEVTVFTIEGEVQVTPETADQAFLIVNMC